MSPRKASRLSRPASERVQAEILRRVTWRRISFSGPLVCGGLPGGQDGGQIFFLCAKPRQLPVEGGKARFRGEDGIEAALEPGLQDVEMAPGGRS